MDPLTVVRRRLAAHRLGGEPFDRPDGAVAWLGAVQAQEYAEAKWSIGQRVDGATDAAVEGAFAHGELLRTHALRPTWHAVTPADIRWIVRLTAPRVHALNRYWYGRFGLDAGVLARGEAVVARALADGAPRTRKELAAALDQGGIALDGLRLGYLLMHAELEEVIVSGQRRGRQQTYALLDQRAPVTGALILSRGEAVVELARRFFVSRGPATVADFTWWSSLTVADAREALDALGPELEREEHDGRAWFAAPESGTDDSTPVALLVPMYDETVVAYRDLKVVMDPPPPREGLLSRPILVDGRTVGSWRRTVTARRALIEATLFGPLDPSGAAALEAAVERFGRFMERPAELRITLATA